jgi:hypothetical protein
MQQYQAGAAACHDCQEPLMIKIMIMRGEIVRMVMRSAAFLVEIAI